MDKLLIILLFFFYPFLVFGKKKSLYFPVKEFNLYDRNTYIDDSVFVLDMLTLRDGSLMAMLGAGKGITISHDGGQTWVSPGKDSIYFRQFIIDSNSVIWGLDYSVDYSYLYKSNDNGRSWQFFSFDLSKMFPVKIISSNYEALKIFTAKKNIYELRGDNLSKDWTLMGYNPNYLDAFVNKDYKVLNGEVLKLNSLNNYDSIFSIKDFEPLDILSKGDTLFIVGTDNTNSFFAYLINNELKQFEKKGAYKFIGIRQDVFGRIWTFGEGGIYLFEGGCFCKKL